MAHVSGQFGRPARWRHPRVEYRLTPLDLSLLGPINAIRAWAEAHVPQVLEARARAGA
ncbi:MAG TPA: hypothetical protein VIU11_26890 [Nakamurella sp.]